jgi:hypothetical protein
LPDILKTVPARFARGRILQFLGIGQEPAFCVYFSQLGRGEPQRRPIVRLWFTHRGVLIGSFVVNKIEKNTGQFPRLRTMDGGSESAWQLKPDRWVCVCTARFQLLKERIFHEAFRGWRYFDFDAYRATPAAKIRI